MQNNDLINWIRLFATRSIGPVTFKQLLSKFKTAKNAIEHLPELSSKAGSKREILIPSIEFAEKYLEKCRKANVELLTILDDDYPKMLKQISDAPMILHIKGRKELLKKDALAIVGSRNASLQGISFTQKVVKELSEHGKVIVSGLARGIDTAAHIASLNTGTIAVVGGGVDIIYPVENKELYEKIANEGVIVAESLLGKEAYAQSFRYRNRIISGISRGVIVIEAAFKSGSLITAEYANEQGRDVFAVPGHPYDPRSQGTNFLIKNGAFIVDNVSAILSQISSVRTLELFESTQLNESDDLINENNIKEEESTSQVHLFLLQTLGNSPISINEIAQISPFSIEKIQWALAELEITGEIIIEQNYVRRQYV